MRRATALVPPMSDYLFREFPFFYPPLMATLPAPPTPVLCSRDAPTATAVSRPTLSLCLQVIVFLRQIPVVACIPGKRDACTTQLSAWLKMAAENDARKCRVIQISITVIEILHQ